MKLTQLEYFCVAARYHNITRASKELFVTQPSVSNAIKALEEEFGVNLFYRNNNKLTLTPEVKSSIKMPKNFWLMRMLSDLNCTNSVSRLHLSASESRQCLEPFTCRICIFL